MAGARWRWRLGGGDRAGGVGDPSRRGAGRAAQGSIARGGHRARGRTRPGTGRVVRRLGAWGLVWLLAGCGGGGKGNPTGPSDIAQLSPDERAALIELNASVNDGRTLRWTLLPIPVFLNGLARRGEVTEWTEATGGLVTFTFVGARPARGISFRLSSRLRADECGVTSVCCAPAPGGEIQFADVDLNVDLFDSPFCPRLATHEVGHAIGVLSHTADGGLMDPAGGNGRITARVAQMLRNLYLLPPGTFVGQARQARVSLGRSDRGYVVRIVDYARR